MLRKEGEQALQALSIFFLFLRFMSSSFYHFHAAKIHIYFYSTKYYSNSASISSMGWSEERRSLGLQIIILNCGGLQIRRNGGNIHRTRKQRTRALRSGIRFMGLWCGLKVCNNGLLMFTIQNTQKSSFTQINLPYGEKVVFLQNQMYKTMSL